VVGKQASLSTTVVNLTVLLLLPTFSFACSCVPSERPCEYLRSDTVFVGKVVKTVPVKHPADKNSWTPGYSMQFAVDESLRGGVGKEVTVETGSGGGDCGTPLELGRKFLIFAYRNEKDGKLWTGMCSGNRPLTGDPRFDNVVNDYRRMITPGKANIFGRIGMIKPLWREDQLDGSRSIPLAGIVVHAKSATADLTTETRVDGTFDFAAIPNGKYTVVPRISSGTDYSHEYPENYEADVQDGQCRNVSFLVQPNTRIRGHVSSKVAVDLSNVMVLAIPVEVKNPGELSGKWSFLHDGDRFDLWPLPPGDYYVGVNINSSPSAERPFPPTYYPGVTSQHEASIVHVNEGEVKELELALPQLATARKVHFTATGLDGKPLRKIYVQLEDLRHPGDASSYVNVDLNARGEGTMTIYAGYSYHLHGSHWVRYGEDWCTKPVVVPAGSEPFEARFIVDHKEADCRIEEIDAKSR